MPDTTSQPKTAALEALLAEIASTAFLTEEMLQESIWDRPEAAVSMCRVLRKTIARMGWMADIGLHRLDSINCMRDGDAAQWMMPPYAVDALNAGQEVKHG